MSKLDKIYSTPQNKVKDFVFDEAVVDVFPDMIQRSVPGYHTIISTIGHLAREYAQVDSNVYDLGCSLGAATLAMRRSIEAANCRIVAVDTSTAMVERCQLHLKNFKSDIETQVINADASELDIENASVVVLNFTLQFIEPDKRDQLIGKIYQGLKPGGILIVSEKLRFDVPKIHETLDELHLDFKRAHGYSELEISQKRTAIENVMLTDTLAQHYQRFEQAGFQQFSQWYQCFNFTSMLAIK